jgi:Holliday junction DNA helicase RuvA
MITAVEGILESRDNHRAIIKLNEISLQIYSSANTLNQLGSIGGKVHLYTFLRLKDDELSLYGFASTEELQLFKLLLSVDGVGPKGALNILSALNSEQLISAIAGGQVEVLNQLPGVGKKLAGRLILELKGKLGGVSRVDSVAQDELITALTNLGFSPAEANKAIADIPTELDLEDRVKLALSHLSR